MTTQMMTYKVRMTEQTREDLRDIATELTRRGRVQRASNGQVDAVGAMEIIVAEAKRALGVE